MIYWIHKVRQPNTVFRDSIHDSFWNADANGVYENANAFPYSGIWYPRTISSFCKISTFVEYVYRLWDWRLVLPNNPNGVSSVWYLGNFHTEILTDPELRSEEVPEEREKVTDADIAIYMSKKEAKEGAPGLGDFAGGDVGGSVERAGASNVASAQASEGLSMRTTSPSALSLSHPRQSSPHVIETWCLESKESSNPAEAISIDRHHHVCLFPTLKNKEDKDRENWYHIFSPPPKSLCARKWTEKIQTMQCIVLYFPTSRERGRPTGVQCDTGLNKMSGTDVVTQMLMGKCDWISLIKNGWGLRNDGGDHTSTIIDIFSCASSFYPVKVPAEVSW